MGYKVRRLKSFSKNEILSTSGSPDFIKGRKYDTDLNRLSKGKTTMSSELSSNQLNTELKNTQKEMKGV